MGRTLMMLAHIAEKLQVLSISFTNIMDYLMRIKKLFLFPHIFMT